jgi:DNA-directed RNA polymerase subunit RPC12/RpoP
MILSYKQQLGVIQEMQNSGFNVCTCGNCGSVILYNERMKEADAVRCPHCKKNMAYSDNTDYYYRGCSEVQNEFNDKI